MTMLWCSGCMVLINLGRVMVHGVLHIEFCLSYSYHGPGELQRLKSHFKQDGASMVHHVRRVWGHCTAVL